MGNLAGSQSTSLNGRQASVKAGKLSTSWFELLCCPAAMGCTVMRPVKAHRNFGEPEYKIKMRLSHSEHVPRYQLHIVVKGRTQQWIVGHIEKTETHLRAKPGEFIRVQVWRLVVNSMAMEARRSALERGMMSCLGSVKEVPTPSADDMMTMGITITTQAKIDIHPDQPNKLDRSTERWHQAIGVENRQYKLTVDPPAKHHEARHHRTLKGIDTLRITYRGRKACVGRKQRFSGALATVEQPYLGVQIKPGGGADDQDWAKAAAANAASPCQSFLDTKGLILLVMCLAWSEETMTPDKDMSERFIKQMHTDPENAPHAPGSHAHHRQSVSKWDDWDIDSIKERLSHIPYLALHHWNASSSNLEEAEDSGEGEGDDEMQGGAPGLLG